jgi:hypothetical protein
LTWSKDYVQNDASMIRRIGKLIYVTDVRVLFFEI